MNDVISGSDSWKNREIKSASVTHSLITVSQSNDTAAAVCSNFWDNFGVSGPNKINSWCGREEYSNLLTTD